MFTIIIIDSSKESRREPVAVYATKAEAQAALAGFSTWETKFHFAVLGPCGELLTLVAGARRLAVARG